MSRCAPTIVVIGLGSDARGDDAAGLLAVRAAARALPRDVTVRELDGEVARILDAWTGADLAVVVDAVAGGGAPGTLRRVEADGPLPDWNPAAGTHALGLAEAVRLGRVLGRMPGRLVVHGIEGACFRTGAAPGDAVLRAVPALAARVVAEVRRLPEVR